MPEDKQGVLLVVAYVIATLPYINIFEPMLTCILQLKFIYNVGSIM